MNKIREFYDDQEDVGIRSLALTVDGKRLAAGSASQFTRVACKKSETLSASLSTKQVHRVNLLTRYMGKSNNKCEFQALAKTLRPLLATVRPLILRSPRKKQTFYGQNVQPPHPK